MNWLLFIAVLIQVESGGDKHAVGDHGKALGVLQIHATVVQDVNRLCHTNYSHKDMLEPKKAKDCAQKYLSYWGKRYRQKTGKEPTAETYARCWNGGPLGYKKSSTDAYWKKVSGLLNQ